jgi:hypothetical protein
MLAIENRLRVSVWAIILSVSLARIAVESLYSITPHYSVVTVQEVRLFGALQLGHPGPGHPASQMEGAEAEPDEYQQRELHRDGHLAPAVARRDAPPGPGLPRRSGGRAGRV